LVLAVFLTSAAWWAVGAEPKGKDPRKDAVKNELKKLEGGGLAVLAGVEARCRPCRTSRQEKVPPGKYLLGG
jgi:hypothetical protein